MLYVTQYMNFRSKNLICATYSTADFQAVRRFCATYSTTDFQAAIDIYTNHIYKLSIFNPPRCMQHNI